MSELNLISGYWKDDKSEFGNYLVNEYNDVPKGMVDDDIFYFGISESDIKKAIRSGEYAGFDFVITSYKPFKK